MQPNQPHLEYGIRKSARLPKMVRVLGRRASRSVARFSWYMNGQSLHSELLSQMMSVQPIKSAKSAGAGSSVSSAFVLQLNGDQLLLCPCVSAVPTSVVMAIQLTSSTLRATRAMAHLVEQEPIPWDHAQEYHWDSLPPEQTTDQGQMPKQLRPEAVEKA
ncbi:MAG: hypothetical protein L6R36_004600 [Xanthoria steineri]|nr:MAG: hypothetical protein L6R36_004600 [Xanthoria steineri]